jgi:hypothetical protein
MAAELFNSIGGYSVGIPPVAIVDANGNVITNVLAPSGNVAANVVYANSYYYSNGQPFNPSVGGSNTQLQFNANGVFGGIPNVTWNGNILTLGDITTVSIGGGIDGYVLQTDGQGNLSWTAQTGGGGGNGSPGGSNTEVQFNNAGTFGGDPGFTYNSITNQLHVTGNILSVNYVASSNVNAGNIIGNYIIGDGSKLSNINASNINGNVAFSTSAGTVATNAQPNITSVGTLTSLVISSNLSSGNANLGNAVNANYYFGNGAYLTGVGNANYSPLANFANYAGNVTVSNQPNITSVGTLTTLTVSGNLVAGNANLGNSVNANYYFGNGASLTGVIANFANYAGNVTVSSQPNITTVGTLLNLDTSGNVLATASIIGANLVANQYLTALNANITGTTNLSGPVVITSTGTLTSQGNINFNSVPNVSLGTVSNIHIGGGVAGYVLRTDGAGNLSWAAGGGGGNGTPGGNTTQVQFNDNGSFAGVANFAFNQYSNTLIVDNVNSIDVRITNNLVVSNTANIPNVNLTRNLYVPANINATGSPNVSFGSVSNLHIQGGTNGYVLSTDGLGNLSWTAGGGGGNGTPGGSNSQVQYNKTGTFAGSSYFTFNDNKNELHVSGNLIANGITIGSGIYEFSRSNVYFATSSSPAPDQTLLAIDATDIAGVEYTIISTDVGASIRSFVKLTAAVIGNVLNYNDYSTLLVNGYLGDFTVTYDPGNVIIAPSILLKLTPQSGNSMIHKMMVTTYFE